MGEALAVAGFILAPLAVLAGVAGGLVALFRRAGREDEDAGDDGIGQLRRVFTYGLNLVALGVAVSGVTLVLRGLLEAASGERVLAGGEEQVAFALALTLVGVPLWLLLWRAAQRTVRERPAEAGALIRKLYVYAVLGVSAAVGAGSLAAFLVGVFGVDDFRLSWLALPLTSGGVWWLHWRGETLEGQPTGQARLARSLYVYVTAAYGLVMLAVSAMLILALALADAYDALTGAWLLSPDGLALGSSDARVALAFALIGAVWWRFHWGVVARREGPSDPRHIYVYLFTAGGAIGALTALTAMLDGVLQWAVGAPSAVAYQGTAILADDLRAAPAALHFRFLSGALAGLVVAAGLWGYHAAVTHGEPGTLAGGQSAARRVYRYLIAAVGIAWLGSGLVVLLGTAIALVTPESGDVLAGEDSLLGPFSLGVAITVVGAAVWGRYWRVLQREAAARPEEERGAQSRRTYIYAVFGVAALIAVGNLSALLFIVLRDLLEGSLAASALNESAWSIGALLTAGAVGIHHLLVLSNDRAYAPADAAPAEPPPRRKSVIVVAASEDAARRIEAQLGYGVRWWRASGGGEALPTEEEAASVAAQVAEAPGEHALVVVGADGARVTAYEPSPRGG